MKFTIAFSLLASIALSAAAPRLPYTLDVNFTNEVVTVSFTNTYLLGVSTLEGKLGRKWVPLDNFYTTGRVGQVTLPLPRIYTTNTVTDPENTVTNIVFTTNDYSEFRVRSLKIAPGNAFTRLALVYGDITTVGGTGPAPTGTNLWLTNFEGAIATSVPFSNPRDAVADHNGNIYVVEQDSHAVSVISTDGRVRTAIGQRVPGFIDFQVDDTLAIIPQPASIVFLNTPSALYYSSRKLYILDSGNGRVLRYNIDTDEVTPFFTAKFGLLGREPLTRGEGLWVAGDESEAFFIDGNILKRWEQAELENGFGGVTVISSNFVFLSDVKVDAEGDTYVTDRGDNVVWRVSNDGFRVQEAGTGSPRGRTVGRMELQGLHGPSSIAFLPVRGYLLGLDQGARVIYVDAENEGATLVFGKPGAHDGDGEWFQKGRRRPKISHVQSVSLAPNGDIIILEDGFVRRIEFLRHKP